MSLISLGLDGLYASAVMTVLSVVTLILTRRPQAVEPPIVWSGVFHGPERTGLAPRPSEAPAAIPAELEPYVDYDRASALHTAPIDFARAMKAAGLTPDDLSLLREGVHEMV